MGLSCTVPASGCPGLSQAPHPEATQMGQVSCPAPAAFPVLGPGPMFP